MTFNLSAQSQLQFDKKYVQCEDKWVAFPADSTGVYNFGFIYIDEAAGLTLEYGDTFKIDDKGKFITEKKVKTNSMKYRLQPNNNLVALIPESKLKELYVDKVPDWLKNYKRDENSIIRLFRWGFMYNGWNECEKALEYLEKANKIDPDYKGLRVELAFSYNCLKQYQKAVDVLKIALNKDPLDAYTNKELIYAETKNGNIEEAENVCRKVFKECKDKTYNSENAYNVLQAYYIRKDIKNFNNWFAEANSYLMSHEKIKSLSEQMKTELKQ
ncbi:hypothetical protein BXU10_18990 [Flavobacterium sp. LM4]|nr:hypothetical protein BXU10_18990 [Flavobacterium sp. LM4]